MSHFHSEGQNHELQLTVRVKFLNLTQALAPAEKPPVKQGGKKARSEGEGREKSPRNIDVASASPVSKATRQGELCMDNRERLPEGQFEEHIENCTVCNNRVELQLDFMNCLESAIYQRMAAGDGHRVHGALMVSAPKMNFAICGELEFD